MEQSGFQRAHTIKKQVLVDTNTSLQGQGGFGNPEYLKALHDGKRAEINFFEDIYAALHVDLLSPVEAPRFPGKFERIESAIALSKDDDAVFEIETSERTT